MLTNEYCISTRQTSKQIWRGQLLIEDLKQSLVVHVAELGATNLGESHPNFWSLAKFT